MTILITGAAGRTSGYVIGELLKANPSPDFRLLVRSEKSIDNFLLTFPQLPRSAFVIGDYLEASTLPPALKGVDVVFHNGPVLSSQETAMGIALIDAAKAAGVKHFVYCSVLLPMLTKLSHHHAKLLVEEYLVESSLNYTILQPAAYMQNVDIKRVITGSVLLAFHSTTTLQGFTDLGDLAAISSQILLDPQPYNSARYEIVNENATFEEVATTFGKVTGADIKCQVLDRNSVVQGWVASNDSDYSKEAFERMLFYYDRRGIPGNNNTVKWLLDREPTSWEALIRREVKARDSKEEYASSGKEHCTLHDLQAGH